MMSKKKKKKQNKQQTVSASTQNEQQRDYLKLDNFGVYFAKVVSIDENQAVLKNVVVDGIRHDGIGFMGSEDHVNIINKKDIKTLKEKNLHPGHKICFMAQSYEYKRKDGSVDFSLCDISDIEIVDDYDIPTKEELIDEQIKNLVCEVCIFNEHCYCGMCVANPDEVKERFTVLKNLQPEKFTPFTVMAAYEIWGKVFSQLGGFPDKKDDPNFQIIEKIKQLSSQYETGCIWPAHDALAHMMYPEFPRKYFY
jgi:hypothetical protein